MTTIFDVLDDFLSRRPVCEREISRLSGQAIYRLGEDVRTFAEQYAPPSPKPDVHPIYLGGGPSANLWDALDGELALSSLLYAGQLLAKDPISDWFSLEQYAVRMPAAARAGFLEFDGSLSVRTTRHFLATVVPALQRLRPLVENGVVVLCPSKRFVLENDSRITSEAKSIAEKVGRNPRSFTREFRPADLTLADNLRGLLVFKGGDRDAQIRRAIEMSARHFLAEHMLATRYGFTYTAPFSYESALCEQGLGETRSHLPGTRVLQAIFQSDLPLLKGLTPEIVAQIRDDSSFGDFRAALCQTYKDIPDDCDQEGLARYIAEMEDAMLAPTISKIRREVGGGVLAKIGVELTQAIIRLAGGFLLSSVVSPHSDLSVRAANAAATAATGFAASMIRKSQGGAKVIWKRLFNHHRKLSEEMPRWSRRPAAPARVEDNEYWGIPENAGRGVHVTEGALMADCAGAAAQTPDRERAGGPNSPYGLCPCGSGDKWKFCCNGLERVRYPHLAMKLSR